MSDLYDAVLDAVPRLRRYTRLLTGSRDVADDYAHVCLERFARMAGEVDRASIPVEMLRTLHRTVSDAEIRLDTAIEPDMPRLERALLALPVDQRKAALLVHVENLSRREAARITGQSVVELSRSLAAARSTLRRDLSASVFIIEDELLVALDISQLVEEFGHSVCGTASRGRDAIDGIEASRPSLLLADVQLGEAGLAGIDTCERIRQHYDVQVIYVTGHPERVRSSLMRDNVFVVPKPVEREVLKRAMGRALGFVA